MDDKRPPPDDGDFPSHLDDLLENARSQREAAVQDRRAQVSQGLEELHLASRKYTSALGRPILAVFAMLGGFRFMVELSASGNRADADWDSVPQKIRATTLVRQSV